MYNPNTKVAQVDVCTMCSWSTFLFILSCLHSHFLCLVGSELGFTHGCSYYRCVLTVTYTLLGVICLGHQHHDFGQPERLMCIDGVGNSSRLLVYMCIYRRSIVIYNQCLTPEILLKTSS